MRVIARNRIGIAAAVVVLLATACGKTFDSETASVTLDAGTELQVTPLTTLSPAIEQAGDEFTATLVAPLMKGEQVIAPQGTTVLGEVVDARAAGPGEEESFLVLEINEIMVRAGQAVAVETEPVRYAPAQQEDTGSATAPAVVPERTIMTFRLAEPVDVPVAIPAEDPAPIS
jgi:hypothetical protein